jgi:class 3 adenylate cyclase/alpha-beta hydrolase superfamily lysophospholipase
VTAETHYARSGDVSIAYQVFGTGERDIVLVPPFVSHVELSWAIPRQAAYLEQFARLGRVILFDKRGTGMSDRVSGTPSLETRMDDMRAVMDAVDSQQAALVGVSEGGPMSTLFAATYPQRAWALVLVNSFACSRWSPDYPHGSTDEAFRQHLAAIEAGWGSREMSLAFARSLAPSEDETTWEPLAASIRQGASPGAALALARMNREIDVRPVLPTVQTPTLLLNRAGDGEYVRQGTRYMAAHIPGARHLEVPGVDHIPFAGDTAPLFAEFEQFLDAAWESRAAESAIPDRLLASVLFTDIVGSTARAVELGDAAWRRLVEAHHALVRRILARYRGTEHDTAGDGFFATFDGPARAIFCAREIVRGVRELDLEVRAGVHTGECEQIDGKVGGIAVNIGARVASLAGPGEVIVSGTVKDLVAGSGITFDELEPVALKGIPGEWRIFEVKDVPVLA